MLLFIKKLVVITFLFIIFDQFFGYVISKLYYNVKSGSSYIANYAIKKGNEDVVIFGASEVSHSLISNQISDSLGLSCYNFGLDGQGIYYQYALIKELLKRYSPKVVIFSSFILYDDQTISISRLYPYYYDHQDIKDLILELQPDAKYKLLIKSYAFNSLILNIIGGYLITEPRTNGYKPLYSKQADIQIMTTPFKIGLTDKTINYFEKIMQMCISAGCKVIVLDVPRYVESNDSVEEFRIQQMLKEYSVDYLHYSTDTTFINHPDLFKDRTHLNNDGAIVFTKMVIERIVQGMKSDSLAMDVKPDKL